MATSIKAAASTKAAASSPYSALVGDTLVPGRTDQGIDFSGAGPVYALGEGTVTRNATGGTGWPGLGAMLVYTLKSGANAGKSIFVAEDFKAAAGIATGAPVHKGQIIGYATGGSSGIEAGFSDPSGVPLAHSHYNEGDVTREGLAFRGFVAGSTSGVTNPRLANGSASSQGGSFSNPLTGAWDAIAGLKTGGSLVSPGGPLFPGGFLPTAGGPGSGIAKWLGVPQLPKNAVQRSAEMLGGGILLLVALGIAGFSVASKAAAPVQPVAKAVRAPQRQRARRAGGDSAD